MRRNIFITLLSVFLLSLTLQSCVKDLNKEGIFLTTRYYGIVQDANTLHPLSGIKVISTNGSNVQQTVYSEPDGSFSINLDIKQLNEGYYISIQPDSLYESHDIHPDNRALGWESFNIGVIQIQGSTVPVLTTGDATEITASSARLHGNILRHGNSAVSECGFVYAIVQYPTVKDNIAFTSNNNGTLETTVQLSPNTTYYVRAFARNGIGIGYGPQITFRTLDGLPTVGPLAITSVLATQATCSGSFLSDGGFPITARGLCWSTTPNPTPDNLHLSLGTGIGDFESTLTQLQPNTTYYLRAYARNLSGIAYSDTYTFTTLDGLPTVTTTPVTDITSNSALSGGTVHTEPDFPVFQRGVCFSTQPMPTTSDSHTSDGAGNGSFISHLSDLTPGTTYYVRAYATNVNGTTYGQQIVFVTQ